MFYVMALSFAGNVMDPGNLLTTHHPVDLRNIVLSFDCNSYRLYELFLFMSIRSYNVMGFPRMQSLNVSLIYSQRFLAFEDIVFEELL